MTGSRRDFLGLFGATALAGLFPTVLRAQPGKPQVGDFGLDPSSIDRSVAPGDDFYRFANGGWLKTTALPDDNPHYSETDRLADLINDRVRSLAEAGAGSADPVARAAHACYASYMDEAAIETLGLLPIREDLARLAAISTPADVARAVARQQIDVGFSPIIAIVMTPNRAPPTSQALLAPGRVGMPHSGYYLDDDPALVAVRTAYKAYVARIMRLGGLSDPDARAANAYAVEEALARLFSSTEGQRGLRYQRRRRSSMRALRGFDWDAYLETLGVGGQENILVTRGVVADFAKLAGSIPVDQWRDFFILNLLRSFAPVGPKAFEVENLSMSRLFTGSPASRPRWERAVERINASMGPAIGKLYVDQYFPPQAKVRVEALAEAVRKAMVRRVETLPWLAPKTRASAKLKLQALKLQVGYPDGWPDFAAIRLDPKAAYANRVSLNRFNHGLQFAKLGKPANPAEWPMGAWPQSANAWSDSALVRIVIPAGLLQPPFFDVDADPAVNYGGIGSVIGHEICHHLDDRGARIDHTGQARQWWTLGDFLQFSAAGDRLAEQFSSYEILPGLKVDGERALGETISDQAGLAVAYDAYRDSLGGQEPPVLGGFTGDQRYFLNFAQCFREVRRETYSRLQATLGTHPPAEFRVATVRNLDVWYTAFNVKPGDKLYLAPDKRVRVW